MKVCHVHQDFVALRSPTKARSAQRFRSVSSLCSSQCYLLEPHTFSKIVCASAASPLLPEPGSSREQSENSLTSPSSAFICVICVHLRHLRLRSFCSAFWLWLRRTKSLRLTPLVIRVAHLLEPHTLSKIVC